MPDDIVITIGGDVSKAEGMFGKLGGAVGGFTSMTLSNLNQVGSTFSNLGSRISEFTDEMVGNFAEFDKSMNTLSVISGENADYLTDDFEAMSEQYGVSVTSIVDATMEIAAAGNDLSTSFEMVNASMDMAVAGMSDVDTASGILVSTLNQFSSQGYVATDVANIFAKVANETSLAVNDMGSAMGYVGANAAAMGYPLEDTAAILGKLKDGGLDASMAGTYLRGMLMSLQAPTSQASAFLEEFDISIRDAQGNMLPMVDIIDNVEAALTNETKAVQDNVIATLFGTRGQTAYNTLVLQGTDSVRELASGLNEAGYAQAMAADMTDNAATQLAKLSVELDNAKRKFGDDFIPATEFATRAEIAFYDILGQIPAPLLAIGGGIAVVIGKTMEALGPMIQMGASLLTLIALRTKHTAAIIGETGAKSGGIAATLAMLGGTIAATAAKIALTVATTAHTIAQWLMNVAMYACPLVWFAAAIAGVVAGIMILVDAIGDAIGSHDQWKESINELERAYEGLQAQMEEFDELLDKNRLEMEKNRLEISKIRQQADREGRELTEAEKDRIHELSEANDELQLSYDEVSIKRHEAALQSKEIEKSIKAEREEYKRLMEEMKSRAFGNIPVLSGIWKGMFDVYAGLWGAAEGAIIKAVPGGVPIIVGEGGEDEIILPLSKLNPIREKGIGAGYSSSPPITEDHSSHFYIYGDIKVHADTKEDFIRELKSEIWRGKRVGA